jgi:hypothetical protein
MNRRSPIFFFLIIALVAATAILIADGKTDSSRKAVLPLPNGPAPIGAFRFAVLGDTGTGKRGQLDIADRLSRFNQERPYDTALLLGDNIYQSGKPADLEKKFERPYADLLRRGVRFYAVLGNHDVRKGRQAQMNYPLFNMGGRAYYSFVKGDGLIEFFAIDSTLVDQEQLRWLDGALANSSARWKIAFFHHPIYSSGKSHGSDLKLRAKLEPIFVRGGVAAVFSGHDHVYERILPQRGISYFVVGASGQLRRGDLDRHSALTAAGNDQVNSFMFVEVTRHRMAFWAVDAGGNILDQGVIAPLP